MQFFPLLRSKGIYSLIMIFFFLREFQPIAFAPNDDFLSLNKDID